MKLTLMCLAEKDVESSIEIERDGTYVVGRDPSVHLTVDDPQISKRHFAVIVEGEKVYVQDLQSKNGTIVNGEPLGGVLKKSSKPDESRMTMMASPKDRKEAWKLLIPVRDTTVIQVGTRTILLKIEQSEGA